MPIAPINTRRLIDTPTFNKSNDVSHCSDDDCIIGVLDMKSDKKRQEEIIRFTDAVNEYCNKDRIIPEQSNGVRIPPVINGTNNASSSTQLASVIIQTDEQLGAASNTMHCCVLGGAALYYAVVLVIRRLSIEPDRIWPTDYQVYTGTVHYLTCIITVVFSLSYVGMIMIENRQIQRKEIITAVGILIALHITMIAMVTALLYG